jgi:hypothetical protein
MCQTLGLWKHESQPLTFTLVVDDFGVKYESKDDMDHLIASIKSTYKLAKDWMGNVYCGISLNWDYINQMVDISMPGYIKKIAGIQPRAPRVHAGMPILTRTQEIWGGCANTFGGRFFPAA